MDTHAFLAKVADKSARIGVVGLGYVGLPLTLTCIRQGFRVIGFDTDDKKVKLLMSGQSYIKHVNPEGIQSAIERKMFYATSNYDRTTACDALIVCVPTPLNANREPFMDYIVNTAKTIAVPQDQVVILESTTYPGTTDGLLKDTLEARGVAAGVNFLLAFSPEREDPGNKNFNTKNIPKIVGGLTDDCLKASHALYTAIFDTVVAVSSTRVAEMSKLLENIFRSVNIALVNELKILCDAMDVDVWEIIDAAATKPFGFMPFYPGPGLGGHCIPVDPFYLTWKAREYGLSTRFIELAGEINTSMHHFVLDKMVSALNGHKKSINGSTILVLGVAYKKDIDDMRESPALPIMQLLLQRGACVRFHDPFIPKLWPMRNYDFSQPSPDSSFDPHSVALTAGLLRSCDAVLIVTNHSNVDYDFVAKHAQLVVDCRNATRHIEASLRQKIVKA